MLLEKIAETAAFLKSSVRTRPLTGIILGSGLSSLAGAVTRAETVPYASIPHFPLSTVEGHDGKLIFGYLNDSPVVVMAGRFHYYEGYAMGEVTFPVRVMKALGVRNLLVSNAAGAMNPDYNIGDIMFLKDHINLFPEHPLRGPNDERLGPRFPDMSRPYDPILLKNARSVAQKRNIPVHEGVYIGLQGPSFETPAEYRYLRAIGGDAVGMSTIPEIMVAIHSGMSTFTASIITDLGIGEPQRITHQEVLAAAGEAAPKLCSIFSDLAGSFR